MADKNLTAERVRELFDYDPQDGRLHRIGKPRRNRISKSDGRYTIAVDFRLYQEHRVVWLWHNGAWPKKVIDHIDRNPLNNRIENLRDVSRSQNKQNQTVAKNNASGYKGVWLHKQTKRWCASISIDRKNIHVGCFSTPEEAHQAYCDAAAIYHTVNPLATNDRD